MTLLIVTIIVGVGTYVSRAIFIVSLADKTLPPLLTSALRYVGAAVLSALAASILVGEQGISGLAPSPELFALIGAGAAAYKTRNVVASLAVGMVLLWVFVAIA